VRAEVAVLALGLRPMEMHWRRAKQQIPSQQNSPRTLRQHVRAEVAVLALGLRPMEMHWRRAKQQIPSQQNSQGLFGNTCAPKWLCGQELVFIEFG